MNRLEGSGRRRLVSGLLLLSSILTPLLTGPAALADDGIALAGTFHLQEYELPQGTEIGNPSIYVVVFNHGDEDMNVRMLVDAPFGVEIALDETEFVIPPGGQRKLYVTVGVTEDAAPGTYDLTITAESSATGVTTGTGARLATASAQKASLVVTGVASRVRARVFTTDGQPIQAQLRFFKVIGEKLNEVSLSETGIMDVTVAPGTYRMVVYVAGRKLGEEEFDVAAGETKELDFSVKTAYIEQFGIEPNYSPDTGVLSFVRLVYTVNNLAGPLEDVGVVLRVFLDGKPLEEVTLVTMGRLEVGRTGGSGTYVPAAGWREGTYRFKLDINVKGEFYIESSLQELSVVPGAPAAPGAMPRVLTQPFGIRAPTPAGISLFWWLVAGVLVMAVVAFFWRRRHAETTAEVPEGEAPAPEEGAAVPEEEEERTPVPEEEAPPEAEPPVEEEEAEEVPEGEIEEPPEDEEEAEEVPEGEVEEPAEDQAEPDREVPPDETATEEAGEEPRRGFEEDRPPGL